MRFIQSLFMLSVFVRRLDPWELPYRRTFLWWLGVWLPAIVAVSVIATESTSTFSSEHTSEWLRPIVEGWFGQISSDLWAQIHHLVRKTGHFVGYGFVCLAFLRSWLITLGLSDDLSIRRWRALSTALAIISTAIVASGDEIHQTMLPDRTGKLSDVVLDSTGAFVICAILWLLSWRGQRASTFD